MQNFTLPIQISSATSTPAQPRMNRESNLDAKGFGQSLVQATERQAASRPPTPAPAPAALTPKPGPQPNAKPGPASADKAPAQATRAADSAKPGQAPAAAKTGKPAAEESGVDEAAHHAAAEAAAGSPVVDMLALVASLNLPPPQAPGAKAPHAGAGAVADGAGRAVSGAALMGLSPQGDTQAGADELLVQDDAAHAAGDTKGLRAPAGDAAAPAKFADAAAAALSLATDKTGKAAPQEQFALDKAALSPAGTAPAQQSTMAQAVANAANAAGDKLTARVGTTAWDNQVSQKIVWMVAGGEQSASLTLNPPDLGPMQVVLNVTNDHADVTFTAAQPEVRQALEDALPRLREMLGETGLSLGNASVNAGMPNGGGAQADTGGARGQGGRPGGPAGGDAPGTTDNGSAAAAEAQAAERAQRSGAVRSMVDTFV